MSTQLNSRNRRFNQDTKKNPTNNQMNQTKTCNNHETHTHTQLHAFIEPYTHQIKVCGEWLETLCELKMEEKRREKSFN